MGDIKRQPTKKRPVAGRLDLTEAREEWLVTGDNILDDFKFEDLFENEEHCRQLWEIHRDRLMRGEYLHEWFATPKRGEKRLPWGFWQFEAKEPRKLLMGKVKQIGKEFFMGYPVSTKDYFDDEQFETDEQYLKRVKPGN